jgi:hypothetical protein
MGWRWCSSSPIGNRGGVQLGDPVIAAGPGDTRAGDRSGKRDRRDDALRNLADRGRDILPRQERSSQTGNHGTTPPYGRELPPGRTRKGEVDSDSLFRVFQWIPWLISDPPGAAIGCCWTESAVRICADLGCLGNRCPARRRCFRSRRGGCWPVMQAIPRRRLRRG